MERLLPSWCPLQSVRVSSGPREKGEVAHPSTPSMPPILPFLIALFHSLALRLSSNVCVV